MKDSKGLQCSAHIHLTTSWMSLHALGVLMFNASFLPLEEVRRSQNCRGLQTPSEWQLTRDDCFALGDQGSFIGGPTNDIAKRVMSAEVQLPQFCGEEHRGTTSTKTQTCVVFCSNKSAQAATAKQHEFSLCRQGLFLDSDFCNLNERPGECGSRRLHVTRLAAVVWVSSQFSDCIRMKVGTVGWLGESPGMTTRPRQLCLTLSVDE